MILVLRQFRNGTSAILALSCYAVFGGVADASEWYKAALHQHSSWSDGAQLPELVANDYKNRGYNFFVFTDHNVVNSSNYWRPVGHVMVPSASVAAAAELFGSDWNVTREVTSGTETVTQLKLKTYAEVKAAMDVPGGFLVVQGSEATESYDGSYTHTNAWNLSTKIPLANGTSVLDNFQKHLAAIDAAATANNRRILAQINHPNAGPNGTYAVSAECIAQTTADFVEVYNAYPDTNHYGDSPHPSEEKIWDIANTIRLTKHKTPLFGTASDDAHQYLSADSTLGNPGRAWVMVRADELSVDAVFDAMEKGDFYASTGVTLNTLQYDSDTRTLTVAVDAKPDANYRIDFIGTLKGVTPTRSEDGTYSSEVGTVLSSVVGTSANYTFTGEELYVRAHIWSDKAAANPSFNGVATEQAWTQPVGWAVPEPGSIDLLVSALVGMIAYAWQKRR